jgi:NIMA-interacting peptidyl-prolyl cis-trans isomerase 1
MVVPRFVAFARALSCALPLAGCVVTTFEGPGEPPRVAPSLAPSNEPENFGETFAEAPARTATAAEAEPRGISARHLLVQYKGSSRAAPGITRTRDEARLRAEEAHARARAGEDFETLVREYSDEPGASTRGGKLGRFERRMMVKEFSDAAFALEVNEISGVVETDFGFHVIQRTE